MEDMFLKDIHIYHIVLNFGSIGNIVLDRVNRMIDVDFLSFYIASKAPYLIVQGDNIGVEGIDQIVERIKRRNLTTSGYVDISSEGTYASIRVAFRIGMNGQVRLIQMGYHIARIRNFHRFLGDEDGYRGPLRIIVLLRCIQDISTDNLRHMFQNLG